MILDPTTNNSWLTTNDLAEINAVGQFRILGRRDNVVCSGGLKLHLEALETKLQAEEKGLLLTSVPDETLGEALVCLYLSTYDEQHVKEHCQKVLTKHEQPRHFVGVNSLPRTKTGKPARAVAKEMALKALFLP